MRCRSVASLVAPLCLLPVLAAPALAGSGRSGSPFVSGTLLTVTGQPYGHGAGPLPFAGAVGTLPSGRAVFAPQAVLSHGHRPGAAPRWPTSNLSSAPPRIIVIGEREPRNPGARVTVVNGSSPALRPESGPKIIRIER
jgi:hypothetical protein